MSSRWAALCLLTAVVAADVQIPAGAELHVRLLTPVAASNAKANQRVEVVVIEPVIRGGQIVIPAGAKITGQVKEVKPAADAERAQLRLAFDQIAAPDGKSAKIDAQVSGVDNARESVDEKGNIVGILASETLSAQMDSGINKVSQRYPGFGQVLQAIKGSVINDTDPDINYAAGVEMTLKLNKPLSWTAPAQPSTPGEIQPAEQLAALVNAQPFRTLAQNPPNPSDITNLMFLGTEQQITDAFTAAGWSRAAALSGQSKLETVRAVAEMRGYKEAPVSILTLEGRPPDLVFEKQNNTFAQRHHLRIWKRPESFNGRQVWVCAATHDTGISFSERDRTFIHKIDPEIDRERSKVANDLLFTGKVKGLALVERPQVPKKSTNGTGDDLITDGRMAVLAF
ncbi:MAG TPA: LssY C-terminal domain-containing protein [Bryobacteraceae bacterium]|jgi:hypothetical protein|nr:LssY C-terminal domain-containing protein [Bryobacteraceae bacterium]